MVAHICAPRCNDIIITVCKCNCARLVPLRLKVQLCIRRTHDYCYCKRCGNSGKSFKNCMKFVAWFLSGGENYAENVSGCINFSIQNNRFDFVEFIIRKLLIYYCYSFKNCTSNLMFWTSNSTNESLIMNFIDYYNNDLNFCCSKR